MLLLSFGAVIALAACQFSPAARDLVVAGDDAGPDQSYDASRSVDRQPLDTGSPPPADAGSCVAIACAQPGGSYCGSLPDGCGGIIVCGDCPQGQICGGAGTAHVCGGDPSCKPISCMGPGYKYCDRIGDGCGHALECGACTAPQTCGGGGMANVCGP
jgi:hypothetical protein